MDRVQCWWNGYHFVGPPSYVLACIFKVLKGDLKHWNKHVFGDVSFRKKCLLYKLLVIDSREGMQGLSPVNRTRRTEVKVKADIAISWR